MNGYDISDICKERATLAVCEYQAKKQSAQKTKSFNNIYVKGFLHVEDFTEDDLKQLFETQGEILNVFMPKD